MRAMAENFARVLESLLANPSRCALDTAAVSLPSQHPRPKVAAKSSTVCELLSRAVASNHLNPALRAGTKSWNYDQLMSVVSAHANKLNDDPRLNTSRDQAIVPVIGESSPESLMAMLGVMYSGAAVVPIDSSQPAIARDDLLADTQATVVLEAPSESGKRVNCCVSCDEC